MKRRILSMLLLFLFSATTALAAEPSVAAQGAALIDAETGRLLWEKNGKEPLAMASTTKIMTAILILEGTDLEEIVTVSKNAASQPEVDMDLREGEQWRTGDLLAAMLLRSFNDAAVALAEHQAGSVAAFCEKMTEKAAEIGAEDTVFGSPNGLDSHLAPEQHHSTAYDMALIGAYALENPQFCEIIAQPTFSASDLSGKHICDITNADRFLREYAGALGIKTGYTNRAGHCFVGAAERDGVRLVTAVLGSGWGNAGKEQKWKDTKALMDYGFAEFEPYLAVRAGDICGEAQVTDSPVEKIDVVFGSSYEAIFSQEEKSELSLKCNLPQKNAAPIATGEEIGRAELWLEGERLAEIPLLAAEDAPLFTLGERLERLFSKWLTWRRL